MTMLHPKSRYLLPRQPTKERQEILPLISLSLWTKRGIFHFPFSRNLLFSSLFFFSVAFNELISFFVHILSSLACSSQTTTVAYDLVDVTTSANDFNHTTSLVTFAAGTTTATLTVTVYGDNVYEPNETFSVTLKNPTNASILSGTGTPILLLLSYLLLSILSASSTDSPFFLLLYFSPIQPPQPFSTMKPNPSSP